jgi:hypothetical protein
MATACKLTASSSLHCPASIYGQPAQAHHFGRKTPDWLVFHEIFGNRKKREKDLESWNIREEGLVISKEKRSDLLIFLFQITRLLF